MKYIFSILLFTSCFSISTVVGKPLKFSDLLEISKDGHVKYYLGENYQISHKNCAYYYMIVQFDKNNFQFENDFNMYYLNKKPFLKGTYEGGMKEGEFTYYYKNGNIKEVGNYHIDVKTGIWKYYYENGDLKKEILFDQNAEFLQSFYDENGKSLVVNGHGFMYDRVMLSKASTQPYLVSGQVSEGLQTGIWKIEVKGIHIATEIFEDKRFVKGISHSANGDEEYFSGFLTTFSDIDLLDRIKIASIPAFCRDCTSASIDQEFFSRFKEAYNDKPLSSDKSINGWILVEIGFKQRGRISTAQTYSSLESNQEEEIRNLILKMKTIELNLTRYESGKLYFPVVIKDSKIYFYGDLDSGLLRSFL